MEQAYASELLATGSVGLGYLLKERVADVGQFVEAVRRVAAGGTALDPEVIAQLVARSNRRDPLARLSPRERGVLSLMAEGRSNQTIARLLVISNGAVEKHVSNIFTKLDLPPNEPDDRRVPRCCDGSACDGLPTTRDERAEANRARVVDHRVIGTSSRLLLCLARPGSSAPSADFGWITIC